MTNSNPSLDPAFNDSLAGAIQFAFNKLMQSTDGMLPAQVIAYDRPSNRVQVQLLISMITTDKTLVPRPQLASLPVLIAGGGNFSLSFPLNAGDMGWVLASDRDISLFLQSYEQSPPNTNLVKNFANGLFIPDIMKSYNFTGSSSNLDYAVLQNNDGTIIIECGLNNTTGANEINITGDRINVTVNNATGYFTINGNLFVSGLIQNPTGTVTPLPIVPPFPP